MAERTDVLLGTLAVLFPGLLAVELPLPAIEAPPDA